MDLARRNMIKGLGSGGPMKRFPVPAGTSVGAGNRASGLQRRHICYLVVLTAWLFAVAYVALQVAMGMPAPPAQPRETALVASSASCPSYATLVSHWVVEEHRDKSIGVCVEGDAAVPQGLLCAMPHVFKSNR